MSDTMAGFFGEQLREEERRTEKLAQQRDTLLTAIRGALTVLEIARTNRLSAASIAGDVADNLRLEVDAIDRADCEDAAKTDPRYRKEQR